jgi:NAD+ kinase
LATVGLLINETKPAALEAARHLAASLRERGVGVASLATLAAQMPEPGCRPLPGARELAEASDFVVVFGGDGTLLSAARTLAPYGKPILGVHLGHFGFLTQVAPEDLYRAVDAALSGDCEVEERAMLEAVVTRRDPDGQGDDGAPGLCETLTGMNDVVVASGAVRMVFVETRIGGRLLATYAADGVIVASPTGSTGYSLSAGGPLIHPASPVFIVNPICPHTLNARPLVIPDTETVRLSIAANRSDTTGVVSIDGQIEAPLAPGDTVDVRRAPHTVRLLSVGGPDFYQKIRGRWGYGERGGS